VHIGCDDVYEPTSFVIDEEKRTLVEFDPMEFIKNLTPSERERFSRICSGDDLLQIFSLSKIRTSMAFYKRNQYFFGTS